jgi:hypothetical protein
VNDESEKQEEPQKPAAAGSEGPAAGAAAEGAAPSEEEIRRQLEEELRKLRVEDLLLQSVASIVNLTARRIAKEDERDLAQGRLGIDAVRAVVDFLPDEPAKQVRNALSELQMLYARHAGEGEEGETAEPKSGGEEEQAPQQAPPKASDARSRLWTPPGT